MSPDIRPELHIEQPVRGAKLPNANFTQTLRTRLALTTAAGFSLLAAACGAPAQEKSPTIINNSVASPTAEAQTCNYDQWTDLLTQRGVKLEVTPVPAGGPSGNIDSSKLTSEEKRQLEATNALYAKWIDNCKVPQGTEVNTLIADIKAYNDAHSPKSKSTEVPVTVLTPSVQNTPEAVKPIAKEEVPAQLDELVKSVQALNEPIFTKISNAEFTSQKENIKIQAQQVEDALKAGDIAKAKERAKALQGSIINLGDPLNSKFLTKEEKQQLDPNGTVLTPFDSVDPVIMENGMFPAIVEIQLALNSLPK